MLLAALLAAVQPAAVGDAILHYLRSNRDGSEPEHVVQFRSARDYVAVYKWVEKCTTAAYVTALMEPDNRQARSFLAGKVARNGSQDAFGFLKVEKADLVLDMKPPGGDRVQERYRLRGQPFLLYDFDFADLNSFLQEQRPAKAFSFALPVIWPGSGQSLFKDLGTLRARFAAKEQHLGHQALRFDLKVEGPKPSTGKLWVDAQRYHIVEAELDLPNHQEYRDFRLRLERVQSGGQSAWNALTKSQYERCPTGN